MKTVAVGLVGAALALTACQTTPPSNPALEDARSAVSNASNDPAATKAASAELQRARDALMQAENAWKAGDAEETRSRAYIAKERAAIATEMGARSAAEQQLAQMGEERERIRAEAREREARTAESRAAAATQQAASASQQAATAQAQADAERQRAEAQARQLQAERDRAAQMQTELQSLQAKSTERGLVVTLHDVLFDVDKAQLRAGGTRSLEMVASVLKNHPERRVLVEGFTDSQGGQDYNRELARRRAEAVKQQLEVLGVSNQKVETRAYGAAYPVADNSTPEGRQQNRRVEIVFSDAQGNFPSR